MTESMMEPIAYSVIITLLAILKCVVNRGQLSTSELRRTFDQILAGTRSIETALQHHRHLLYGAHQKLNAVTKRLG